MVYYDRIDVSERIDINKTSTSKCATFATIVISLDKGFKFQPYVCNGCHDKLLMSINLNNIAILNMNGAD